MIGAITGDSLYVFFTFKVMLPGIFVILDVATFAFCTLTVTVLESPDAKFMVIFAFPAFLPVTFPVLFTVAIFSFTASWNDFYSPLLYINDDKKYTLAYGLYIFFDKFKVGSYKAWNIICAANLVVIVPIIVLYFFAQRYFVEGITLGGVKG